MNARRNISLGEIGQISVNAHDLERAVAFYKDTLGLKHLFSVPSRMAFFDCNGVRLMLAIPERPDLLDVRAAAQVAGIPGSNGTRR